jgi:hypothetical protein
VTTGMSRDPTSHGGISVLVPAAATTVPPGANQPPTPSRHWRPPARPDGPAAITASRNILLVLGYAKKLSAGTGDRPPRTACYRGVTGEEV